MMILANLKMTCFKTTTCPWFRPKFLIYEKDLIKLNLRNGEASDGETRDDVRAEKGKVVERGPLENGEKVLKCKEELDEACLVLEPVEWIIWEEDLRESVSEFLQGGAFWWQPNLVNFQGWHLYLSLDLHVIVTTIVVAS